MNLCFNLKEQKKDIAPDVVIIPLYHKMYCWKRTLEASFLKLAFAIWSVTMDDKHTLILVPAKEQFQFSAF